MYLLFQGEAMNCGTVESKNRRCPIFDGRVGYTEQQRKFNFVTVNNNTPSDQAESSMSCYRMTTLYTHALETRNLPLVSVLRRCQNIDILVLPALWAVHGNLGGGNLSLYATSAKKTHLS